MTKILIISENHHGKYVDLLLTQIVINVRMVQPFYYKCKIRRVRRVMFQQVRQNRMFQDVIYQIEEAILDGRLRVGDRLPPERELKEMFKTSRGTLREALRVLEQKGLISIKTGVNGGSYISAVTTHQVSESLDLLIRYQKISLSDLAEFREGVEGLVASLAAGRADREGTKQLQRLLYEAKKFLSEGMSAWDAFIRNDNALHMELARIAGNPVYESVLRTVHDNINRYYEQFLPRSEEVMKENYEDLRRIVDAVVSNKPEDARRQARVHVRRFNRFMEKKGELK